MSSVVETTQIDKENGDDQCVENIALDENNDTDDDSNVCIGNSPDGDHDHHVDYDHNIICVDSKHNSTPVCDDLATVSSNRCCATCRTGCLNRCSTERNPLSTDASCAKKLRFAFLCPPHGNVARTITLVFVIAYIWCTLWSVLGDAALPGGNYFALITLLVLCVIAGEIVEKVHLPPLLGMYMYQKADYEYDDLNTIIQVII